jgi:hypothetical protein
MLISFSLTLPQSSDLKIFKKIGDSFDSNESLAEYSQSSEKLEIDISQKLNVSRESAASFLLKNLGDSVEKDEIIARNKTGLIFKKTVEVKSMYPGKIYELDNFTGKVVIAGKTEKKSLSVPFSGKVADLNKETMTVEFKGEEITPKNIYGESFLAPVFKISKMGEEVDDSGITVDHGGSILIGGHFALTDLNRAMACGVRGVVAGSVSGSNLEEFVSHKQLSFLSGGVQVLLSIAVLEEEQYSKLEHLKNGQGLYFDGVKGKIIIPHS